MSDTSNSVGPQLTNLAWAACRWCGGMHSGKCSLVKAVDYWPDGTVKRVEFYDPPLPSPVS